MVEICQESATVSGKVLQINHWMSGSPNLASTEFLSDKGTPIAYFDLVY
jgi:hypothetical protein